MTSEKKQKIKDAAPWAALIAMIPTLVVAWQSRDDAQDARSQAKKKAADVLVETERRDDLAYRTLRRAIARQGDALDLCQQEMEDMSEALEELYDYVGEHSHRNGTPPPSKKWSHDDHDQPSGYGMGQMQVDAELPEEFDDLVK